MMSESMAMAAPGRPMLDYLPVGLFGSVMGLTGLSVAWRLAQVRYGAPGWVATAIAALAVLAFVALLIGYGIKVVMARDAVQTEFRHPIAGNLFGTVPISLLLLPIVVAPYGRLLAQALWIFGAAGMVTFAWFIVSRWMSDRQQVAHATPAWIIPVVGMLDVPLAPPSLGLPPIHGLMVFALAVGLFFAMPLFTLVFSRLVFEPPLPDALKPSLLILMAPFAVGSSGLHGYRGPDGPVRRDPVHADAVRARRPGRATAAPAVVLPVPRVLVGGRFSPCSVEHRRPALRRGSAGIRHGCGRPRPFGAGNAGHRRTARPHGPGPDQRRATDFEHVASLSVATDGSGVHHSKLRL